MPEQETTEPTVTPIKKTVLKAGDLLTMRVTRNIDEGLVIRCRASPTWRKIINTFPIYERPRLSGAWVNGEPLAAGCYRELRNERGDMPSGPFMHVLSLVAGMTSDVEHVFRFERDAYTKDQIVEQARLIRGVVDYVTVRRLEAVSLKIHSVLTTIGAAEGA